ncbi:MAG: IS4 family transposase [Desulfoferrobacter sp.]
MNKSTHFSGHPIIKQLLQFIDPGLINRTAQAWQADRYYKRFKTYDHLVTMLFVALSGVSSLRELSSVMLACEGKINHLNMRHFPRRSTISDANAKRESGVFAEIYHRLLNRYRRFLSDSSPRKPAVKELRIIDSTTISLFTDILKGPGRPPLTGKKKGGIKMHTMINVLEDVPQLVRFSSAARHDHTFLEELDLPEGSFVVFDKGYTDYSQYERWSKGAVFFVTRQKDNAAWQSAGEYEIADSVDPGVIKDERITITKDDRQIRLRRIAYYHATQDRTYIFLTNNHRLGPDKIAQIYKNRWQIESMFKRLKQNFPLKYFLGDSQNAIEIQIWVSLIAQLLMLVVQRKAQRRWAFSNMVGVIRYHLTSYIDLFRFLKDPDQSWRQLTTKPPDQLTLFG